MIKSESDTNAGLESQTSVETEASGLNTSVSEDGAPKVQRKRKWLNNEAAAAGLLGTKKSLTISSDTLKNVLPTPSPQIKEEASSNHSEPVGAGEDLAASESGNAPPPTASTNGDTKRKFIEADETNGNEAGEQLTVVRQQSARTVILEVGLGFDFILIGVRFFLGWKNFKA